MPNKVIVVREKDSAIPQPFLEAVFKQSLTHMSLAAFTGNDDEPLVLDQMAFDADNVPPTVEEVLATDKDMKDVVMVYRFANTEGLNETDVQPYTVLVDKEDNPTVLMFLSGDFNSYAEPASTYSEEYMASNKYIIPKLKKIFANVGQDLDKFYGELNDPMTKTELTNCITGSGAITLLVQGHTLMTFDKQSGGSQFPWGWVSDPYGYTETPPKAAAPEPKPVKQAVKSMFGQRKGLSKPIASTEPVTQPKPATAVPAPPAQPDNKEGPKEPSETEHKLVEPPPGVHGDAKRRWFNDNCLFVPNNWYKAGVKAPYDPVKAAKNAKRTEPVRDLKDLKEKIEEKASKPFTPDPNRIKKVQGFITTLDANGFTNSVDVKQLQAVEAKHPTFFELTGQQDYTLFDGRSREALIALGKMDLEFLVSLMEDWRSRMLTAEHDVLVNEPAMPGVQRAHK